MAGVSCNKVIPVSDPDPYTTVKDANGNVYTTLKIGNQVWMAENFRATKYIDGTPISSDSNWNNAASPKYCFYNNAADSQLVNKYGALYNWYVVSPANPKKLAPQGWHVPSDAQWDTLLNYLIAQGYNWDGSDTGNKIAKSLAARTDWAVDSTPGTIGCDLTKNNTTGFSALPGGHRSGSGAFYAKDAVWWSSTACDSINAWYRYLGYNFNYLLRGSSNFSCGFSVRLIRD
jgi:uncharacterized protein (TIGR02145 family)